MTCKPMNFILLMLLIAGQAQADTDHSRIAANIALLADWGQTRNIAMDTNYYEKNSLLGEKPTLSDVNQHFIMSLLVINLIGENISHTNRSTFYWTVAGLEFANVIHNFHIGLSIKF